MHAGRARYYKDSPRPERTVLVLGAGNITAIPVMDVVTKLFNEGKVCLLKMSPVNDYLGPFLEEAFSDPIQRGFLSVVYGGAEEGGISRTTPGSTRSTSPAPTGPTTRSSGGRPARSGTTRKARQRTADHQTCHRRIGERIPRSDRAWALQRSRAGVPGGEYRRRGGDERLVRLQSPPRCSSLPRGGAAARRSGRVGAGLALGTGTPGLLSRGRERDGGRSPAAVRDPDHRPRRLGSAAVDHPARPRCHRFA